MKHCPCCGGPVIHSPPWDAYCWRCLARGRLTEAQEAERENARLDWQERFEEYLHRQLFGYDAEVLD